LQVLVSVECSGLILFIRKSYNPDNIVDM
jgi:hypothetical protein